MSKANAWLPCSAATSPVVAVPEKGSRITAFFLQNVKFSQQALLHMLESAATIHVAQECGYI